MKKDKVVYFTDISKLIGFHFNIVDGDITNGTLNGYTISDGYSRSIYREIKNMVVCYDITNDIITAKNDIGNWLGCAEQGIKNILYSVKYCRIEFLFD